MEKRYKSCFDEIVEGEEGIGQMYGTKKAVL
jgi:hypothetical protein